jgi:hypothetical protein
MSDDVARVRELLERDHLDPWEVRELREVVGRNQNEGVFSEEEWRALRGWANAEFDRLHLRAQASSLIIIGRGTDG